MVEKAKQKPLGLHQTDKIVIQNQYHILGGIAEISATIKDLMDAGTVFPTTFLFNFACVEERCVLENDGRLL